MQQDALLRQRKNTQVINKQNAPKISGRFKYYY
jgi:hypothetical protein